MRVMPLDNTKRLTEMEKMHQYLLMLIGNTEAMARSTSYGLVIDKAAKIISVANSLADMQADAGE